MRARSMWTVLGVLALIAVISPGLVTYAQDDEDPEATISALETRVAELETQAADDEAEPSPTPGLLYEADWSSGRSGWRGTQDWKAVSGMLVNDGNNFESGGSLFEGSDVDVTVPGVILAPYQPEGIADYAVEAEIQRIGNDSSNDDSAQGFGLVVRASESGAYWVGFTQHVCCGTPVSAFIGAAPDKWNATNEANLVGRAAFDPGDDWHTWRAEVEGNEIRLFVDGELILEGLNNRFLDPGQIGLWSSVTQINVRSFRVIAL